MFIITNPTSFLKILMDFQRLLYFTIHNDAMKITLSTSATPPPNHDHPRHLIADIVSIVATVITIVATTTTIISLLLPSFCHTYHYNLSAAIDTPIMIPPIVGPRYLACHHHYLYYHPLSLSSSP